MNDARKSPWLSAFSVLSVCLCIALFYKHCIWSLYTSPDTGWLARSGIEILSHGLPFKEPFSWTVTGASVVNYQWLFEVLCAFLFQRGSIWLVGFAAALAAGLLMLFLLPRLWTRLGIPIFIPYLLMSALPTPNWFQSRPQLGSYFLILTFVAICERYRLRAGENACKSLWLLPPLMVLWCNFHAFWFIGLIIVAAYFTGELNRVRRLPIRLGACLLLCMASIFLNPYGVDLVSYLFSFLDGGQYLKILEVQPVWNSAEGLWSVCLFPVMWLLLIRKRRHVPAEGLWLCAAGTLAAFAVNRLQPVAVMLAWTYVGLALASTSFCKAKTVVADTARRKRASAWFQAAAALAAAAACFCLQMPNAAAAWMIFTEDSWPLLACAQKVSGPQDRLFNDPAIGSWLVALGGLPVFVDSRFDAYPKPLVRQMNECLEGRRGWDRQLDRWGITEVLVRDEEPLYRSLMYTCDWQLALDDGHFSWWLRGSERSIALMHHWSLEDDRIRLSALPPWIIKGTVEARAARCLLLARLYRSHNLEPLAEMELRSGLRLLPASQALLEEQKLCSTGASSGPL